MSQRLARTWRLRHTATFFYLWLSATIIYPVNRSQRDKRLRTWVCLGVSALHFLLLPWLIENVDDPLSVIPTAGIVSFSAFKIIALTMNRGVLPHVSTYYWQFVAACCLPVIPETAFNASRASRHTGAGSKCNSTTSQIRSLISRLGCGLVATVAAHLPAMPRLAVFWLYVLILNMFLGALTDCFAVATTAVLGMKLAPCFDRPYCSATFAEFWGQRWNVTTTYLFRVMIYDPIVEGRFTAEAAFPATPLSPPSAAAAATAYLGPHDRAISTAAVAAVVASDCPSTCQECMSTCSRHLQQRHLHPKRATEVADIPDTLPAARVSQTDHGALSQGSGQAVMHATAIATHLGRCRPTAGGGSEAGQTPAANDNESRVQVGTRGGSTKTAVCRLIGMQATFVVSAAWHVLLYWLLTGSVGWEWPVFFLVQGPIVIVEGIVRKAMRNASIRVPHPVGVVCTNVLLIMLADPLLISPLVNSGVVGRMFAQARLLFGPIVTALYA